MRQATRSHRRRKDGSAPFCWTRKSALIAQGSFLHLVKPTRIWSALSTFTNSNAASVMELPVAGWRRLPNLFLHVHRNLLLSRRRGPRGGTPMSLSMVFDGPECPHFGTYRK